MQKIKIFIQKISITSLLLKAFVLFMIGLLARALVVHFSVLDFWLELFAITFFSLSEFLLPVDIYSFKLTDDKMNMIYRRGRDLIMSDNYDLKDKCRRRGHWLFYGQFNSKYESFTSFKQEWNNENKLSESIQGKIEEKKRELLIIKKTIEWILNRRNS